MTGERGPDGARSDAPASLPYFPGLDGLRGFGMVAVLIYHSELGVQGAALAVSQFFTFSGYLITALVLRRNSFHTPGDVFPFWARRYRRLAPAALLALLGAVVFGATVATEQQLEDLPGAVAAALAQIANWHFIFSDVSYVEIFQAPSPIQHFWSLAIEEQFYILMPLVLLVAFRLTKSLPKITVAFAAAALGSSALMFTMFDNGVSIDRLYYGTDTRAAEILVGCVLALVLYQRPLRLDATGRRALSFAAVVAAAVTYWMWFNVALTDSVLYRGGFLLHAVLTTVLIMAMTERAGPVAAIFSIRPLAWAGRLSYTVYVFHWPIYLWLDADRVGTDGWTLFAVRVAVTLGASVVSLRFFETPIRSRRIDLKGLAIPAAYAAAAVVLLVAVTAVSARDVRTDLAGLDTSPSATPPPSDQPVEPLRVLVIPDDESVGASAELTSFAPADTEFRTGAPFSCVVHEEQVGRPCANFEGDWAAQIAEFDPDVVFFFVTFWETADIREKSALDEVEEQERWSREQLGSAVDVLASAGATVVHGNLPLDMTQAVARANAPFPAAIRDLATSDPRVREIGWITDLEKTALDLRAHDNRVRSGGRRVLVLGDSVARNIGYGLEQWAGQSADYLVWAAATPGCGIADDGFVSDPAGREVAISDTCAAARASWAQQVEDFRPDVVVITSGETDFQRRRLEEWERMLAPGDPVFDDYLVAEYTEATDVLASFGAEVVWVQPACADNPAGLMVEPDGRSAFDTSRISYVNEEIFSRVAAARSEIRLFDMFEILCPAGEFEPDIGLENLRPDGVHFSPEGAVWLAETYGELLLGGVQ